MFSIASIQAHPGQSVTMWCSHNIHVSGNLCWFKQTDGAVPITIVCMQYTESLQKVEPNYYNNFTKDLMVMDLFSKSTTLTIKQVKISDSGFYFCGATRYHMKFGNGTRLEVEGNLYRALSLYSNYYILFIALFFLTLLLIAHVEKHHNLNATMVNDLSSPTVFTSEKNYTGTSKKGMFFTFTIKVKTTCV